MRVGIFEVKLTFDMLTVRGKQHSFSAHERVFLWKCQSFWDRKCLDLKGTRTPKLRINAECFNLLSYQGQTFAVPCFFNTGSGGIDIFEVKLTFDMLTGYLMASQSLPRYLYHNVFHTRPFETYKPIVTGYLECHNVLSENVSDIFVMSASLDFLRIKSVIFSYVMWWYRYC